MGRAVSQSQFQPYSDQQRSFGECYWSRMECHTISQVSVITQIRSMRRRFSAAINHSADGHTRYWTFKIVGEWLFTQLSTVLWNKCQTLVWIDRHYVKLVLWQILCNPSSFYKVRSNSPSALFLIPILGFVSSSRTLSIICLVITVAWWYIQSFPFYYQSYSQGSDRNRSSLLLLWLCNMKGTRGEPSAPIS